MVMLDFICKGSAELFGTGREKKNKKKMSPAGFEPTPGTMRQVNKRFRPLGHDSLMMICGIMSYRIVGYKLIKTLRDNTFQIDYGYMCI